jgi:hypothetical protein
MKFGRRYAVCYLVLGTGCPFPLLLADRRQSLPRNQVPEWSSAYINYKGLKKLIKAASEVAKTGQDADLTGDRIAHNVLAISS